jgi:CheY-like chemotaxis protein
MIEMQTQDKVILKEARIIQEAALRAADVVKRLALAVGGENDVPMPVDVSHIVREAISASRPRWKDEAEANGITLDIVVHEHAVPHVRATPNGLRNVLLNVISNAVDAMTKSGRITLECKQIQDLVQISISDTGIGMDEETCRRIFEPFFTTKAHVGTGLGMATVFTSISRWGGHIEVKSTPGKGTSVVMALPIWKTDLATLQTPVHANRSGRVLIVEDEQIVRSFLERILSKHHHVDTALDGFEALALIEKQVYDVALVDLGMPGMPGDQVAQQIREYDAHMAIILITGWDLVENERLKVFDDYLKKPFDTVDKILSAVSRAIHLRDERVQKDTQIE